MINVIYIRYKDGRDKTIFCQYVPILKLPEPTVISRPHFPPQNTQGTGTVYTPSPSPLFESIPTLTAVPPLQVITDKFGNSHMIAVNEILDMTIEAIEDDTS